MFLRRLCLRHIECRIAHSSFARRSCTETRHPCALACYRLYLDAPCHCEEQRVCDLVMGEGRHVSERADDVDMLRTLHLIMWEKVFIPTFHSLLTSHVTTKQTHTQVAAAT
jgi:hypothetical protein